MPPPSQEPRSLRRLREWKTRMVMPEALGEIGGFSPPDPRGVVEAKEDAKAAFARERDYREWASGEDAKSAARRREAVDREIANRVRPTSHRR